MRTLLLSLTVVAAVPLSVYAQSAKEVRSAIDRALKPIQSSAQTFVQERACFSCHHNALTILTLRMAQQRGVKIDDKVLTAVEDKTWRSGGTLEDVLVARNLTDPTPNDSLLLMAQEAAGRADDAATQVRVRRLASWQREDGHWITSDFRPPHSSSLFTTTATAVRALREHTGISGEERDRRIATARRWLAQNHPISTEDASFRLMGLAWAKASAEQIAGAQRDLLAFQKPDGGWPQTPAYGSDAYSTGEAIFALFQAGVQSPEGIRFLIGNQDKDGKWLTTSRMLSPAEVSPPFFETGFGYDLDEFLSYAGSTWATMALLTTLPETKAPPKMPAAAAPPEITLTGWDRLLYEASFYGNATAVEKLLDSGVSPNPESARGRVTPLRLASMSGDVEMVRTLLAHGADPDAAGAFSEAVTFGHAEVAKLLLDAGASAGGVDSSGINLLHWATITNRSALIPILKAAGVPLNETDSAGFTPLMYAATIDFGETKTLEALLAAGADTSIKNHQEQTPLQQAESWKHAEIVRILRARAAATPAR